MSARWPTSPTLVSALPLRDADDPNRYGGKAVALGVALRAGLPVPDGVALCADLVAAVVAGEPAACDAVARAAVGIPVPLAVRSSAVGEDGAEASFAGQHLSVLNVCRDDAVRAVADVGASASAGGALAYRRRMGVTEEPRCGVVLQRLVDAEVAGVLFSRNPLTGADERVVEASWSLGEAVVSGLVTPDLYRLARDGALIEAVVGRKDTAIVPVAGGGTQTRAVDAATAARPCLGAAELRQLADLADECERVYGGDQDIEWAFARGTVMLLQRRPVTAAWSGR